MKTLTITILTCGILGIGVWQTSAAAQLRLSDGTTTVIVVDEGPGDAASGRIGQVEYVGPVGPNWYLDVTVGTGDPLIGSPSAPAMDIGTANNSSGAGTLTIDFTQDGFTSGGSADLQIGGVTVGQVTYQVFADQANTPFAKTTLIGAMGPLAGGAGGAFSGETNGIVSQTGPYSLTMETIIQHTGAGHTGFDANLTVTPPACNCTLTFNSPTSITNCADEVIPDVTATQNCGAGPVSVPVTLVSSTTSGTCPAIITRKYTATDNCGVTYPFTQTITVNCKPDCTITTVTAALAGATNISASVADAGAGATYSWTISNGTITGGQGTTNITWTAGTTNNPTCIFVTVTTGAGCSSSCSACVRINPPPACTIPGVIISNTSWNKFNIPTGTSPLVWVHMHIGGLKGIPTNGVNTIQFAGVTLTLNGTPYTLPDGVLVFDSSASSTITTTFSGGKWITTINPKNLSDEIFFDGAAIPVTASVAAGAKADLTYNTVSSIQGISFNWQWSAAVYTFWPADWNQAGIQPYHGGSAGYHAGTPTNTTVQKSLIQGPRGGGGSNFTGSWSATGTAACQ